jgi:sugar transferase (PEP-CTERM/EpsH1 system associated)
MDRTRIGVMNDILFIGHRIPFPPDRGDKIRSHHILKALAQIAPVHVATFADDDADLAEEAELAHLACSYRLVRRKKPLVLAGMQALLARGSVSKAAFFDQSLADYIAQTLASHPIATIYVFSGQMGQYVPADFTGRVIADFVDVDSAKFEAYGKKGKGPMRWVNAREAKVLRAEEAQLAQRADASLLITQEEAQLFTARLSAEARKCCTVDVLGNGIDSDFFHADLVLPEPKLEQFSGGKLIFTGQMDYGPNVDAVVRMARRILPIIRRELPETTFHIVGRNPVRAVADLAALPGSHVWGRVDDMRTWLKGADMAVAPLDIARGVQNKVLEAMAMELPVVLSSAAATGIGAADGQHFAIADSDAGLAGAAIRLLRDADAARVMGQQARQYVVDVQSWQAAMAELPGLIRGQSGGMRDAA